MNKRAKKLKTEKNGVWQKLLDSLSKSLGKVVPNEVLIDVSGQHNYARRIRELRAEGWDIVYNANSPSGYVLRSEEKISKSADVYINFKLRHKVLERDNYTCQLCGQKANDKYDGGTVKMEVDHKIPLKQGGKTVEENLWSLCNQCNAGKKSLFDYPETIKNKVISLNLPDDLRKELSDLSLKKGDTVNTLILEAIRLGLKKLN